MIYVTGDTHGKDIIGPFDGYMNRLSLGSFPEQNEMTKDDYVVILGDFGGVWQTSFESFDEHKEEKAGLDWLDKKPFTTLFVPGNHENYSRLTGMRYEDILSSFLFKNMSDSEKERFRGGYPQKRWHGGTVREIRPSVLMLEPGVFEIDGKKCFTYGGAQSHDIAGGVLNPTDYSEDEFAEAEKGCFRILGLSWWEEEQPDPDAEKAALDALSSFDNMVDFVFTHTPPASVQAALGFSGRTRIDRFLEKIKQDVSYGHWFSGHLHVNTTMPGGKDHVLYEQILRVA